MSVDQIDEDAMRVGRLACACPPGADREAVTDNRAILAACFGLAVLAQALTLTVLPEQSRLLAPTAERMGWPFALLLVGAALATFPAAMLVDAFGRRAAFGLGASLGAAGGALCAFSLTRGNFFALCLGAFWLGLAQGFALFYRHIAAQGSARGGLVVLAGGAGAALAAPLVVSVTGSPGATLLAAAALHIVALALSVRLPHALRGEAASHAQGRLSGRFALATLAGAVAWFVMAAGMLHGPLTLAVCSAGPALIGGAMGWHLFAMYGPAALAARWPSLFPPIPAAAAGLLIMFAGAGAIYAGASIASVAAGLIAIGVGWSLVNVATLRMLHEAARPPCAALALHDFCLLGAAAAGALMF
ncbi:MFS transporter [Methylocystis sp. WRRC1]|uniref:MFS transporter n=1 Tax=Methylocystis sp. WRRC1 TaxID=1732014 RepID=UPI001D13E225|nr:MFS transporter [Methylocystis sp. WRRC1]